MQKKSRLFFQLTLLEGIGAFGLLLSQISESKNRVFYSYSSEKLVLIGFTFLALLIIGALYIYNNRRSHKQGEQDQRKIDSKLAKIILSGTFFLFSIFSIITFLTPSYRFSDLAPYLAQLKPILIWFALINLQGFVLLAQEQTGLKRNIDKEKIIFRSAIFFLLILIAVWIFIAISGLGIKPDDHFWNVTGVPLLNEQVVIAVLISLLVFTPKLAKFNFAKLKWRQENLDTFLFFLLWVIAAIVWIRVPLPKNFFAAGLYPPNYEYYPYADPSYFDISAQFAVIGQGLFNGQFYDRALLSGILAIGHLLFGQSYTAIVNFQIALFATIVPALYLIGKHLHTRLAGFFLALLTISKVSNAIAASTIIQTSHPKFYLTEFPTAVLLAFLALALIQWDKTNQTKHAYLGISGALLGLGIMLRTNVFLLFSVPLGFIFFSREKSFKQKALYSSLLLTAFFITISPWMWRSAKVANKPFFFLPRLNLVLSERYSTVPFSPSLLPQRALTHGQGEAGKERSSNLLNYSEFSFIPNHFLHNVVASILILPTSFEFHALPQALKESLPYWNKASGNWEGALTLEAKTFIATNLFLIALGLSLSWKKQRYVGLGPLFIFLIYHLSNGLARTSGGRYVVPVDWVVLLYFAIGLIYLVQLGLEYLNITKSEQLPEQPTRLFSKITETKSIFLAVLPFFLLVMSIVVVDQFIPAYYEDKPTEVIISDIIEITTTENMLISETDLLTFAEDPNARILQGKALYPRFYPAGKGEQWTKDAFEPKDFRRLTFEIVGPAGNTGVLYPIDKSPTYFPNSADILLVGCQHPSKGYIYPYIDALMIILIEEDQNIIFLPKSGELKLQCSPEGIN